MNKQFILGLLQPEFFLLIPLLVNTIRRNGGGYSTAVTASYGKSLESSAQPLCEPENSQAFLWLCKALRLGEAFIKFLISHPNLAKMITRELSGSHA
jgi:hypothetical protein